MTHRSSYRYVVTPIPSNLKQNITRSDSIVTTVLFTWNTTSNALKLLIHYASDSNAYVNQNHRSESLAASILHIVLRMSYFVTFSKVYGSTLYVNMILCKKISLTRSERTLLGMEF